MTSFTILISATIAMSDLHRGFVEVFQPDVSRLNPSLRLFVSGDENADYLGGAALENSMYRITIGNNVETAMGPDLAILSFCHELGHLLGAGARKPNSTWAATEAEADYYAAHTCARKYWKNVPFHRWPNADQNPMEQHCSAYWRRPQDQAICAQIGTTAARLFSFIWTHIGLSEMARSDLNSRASVHPPDEVQNQYPSLQCRLDTMVDGAFNKDRPNCH